MSVFDEAILEVPAPVELLARCSHKSSHSQLLDLTGATQRVKKLSHCCLNHQDCHCTAIKKFTLRFLCSTVYCSTFFKLFKSNPRARQLHQLYNFKSRTISTFGWQCKQTVQKLTHLSFFSERVKSFGDNIKLQKVKQIVVGGFHFSFQSTCLTTQHTSRETTIWKAKTNF